MTRRIIKIDEAKCNGCGICVDACHEGAIQLINGKAVLVRDDYCDGLGDCLPTCPTNAITFEEREAAAYDEEAVKRNMLKKAAEKQDKLPCGCPSTSAKTFDRSHSEPADKLPCGCPSTSAKTFDRASDDLNAHICTTKPKSELRQFPVQIKLISPNAPFFDGADVLIAADCTAFAYGNFHEDFIKGKITLIGCPKLDMVDYSEKLTDILLENDVKSLTVVRMEVPCCGGITEAVKLALKNSGKIIPWSVVTVSRDGRIL